MVLARVGMAVLEPFERLSADFDGHRTDSSCCQQLWQSDEVVGCGGEGEEPADAGEPAVTGLGEVPGGLDPAISLPRCACAGAG